MKRANTAKVVNKSSKRRMNALLQIALMRSVDLHGYVRPEVAQCYSVNTFTDTASFYFDSAHGREVGDGEATLSVSIHESNDEIIIRLISCIRSVTGHAEHEYRRKVRQSMNVAIKSYPDSFRTICATACSLL